MVSTRPAARQPFRSGRRNLTPVRRTVRRWLEGKPDAEAGAGSTAAARSSKNADPEVSGAALVIVPVPSQNVYPEHRIIKTAQRARTTMDLDCSVPSRERNQRAPNARPYRPTGRHGSAPKTLRARSRPDLVDQGCAYACPVQPCAPAAPARSPPRTGCSAAARAAPPCHGMPCAVLIRPREIPPRNSHLRRAPERETASQAPVPLHEVRA